MKKLLTITIFALILIPALVFAQAELVTADTVAVAPSFSDQAMQALYGFFAILLNFISIKLYPMALSYLKSKSHNKYTDVITDSFFEALNDMTEIGKKILADGVITQQEKTAFKAEWRRVSKDKLMRLSGFAKKDVDAWIDEQMRVTLGKLLGRVLG